MMLQAHLKAAREKFEAVTVRGEHFFHQPVDAIRRKAELGDALLLLYVAVFVRQYLWAVDNNTLAWGLTVLFSALLWCFHLLVKEPVEERTPRLFWLIVALPLFVIYAGRVVFPDLSFDVLNYRLLHAERALSGFPFLPGDFFPTPAPFNPAPDMVTGISRHILGYRLGTIINYLVMVWVGAILNKFLRPYFKNEWLRCCAVLLVVLAEHLLFEINNYMADLLALPLLLEATYLVVRSDETTSGRYDLIRIALLLGASVAFKLTNVAMVLPIISLYAYKSFATRPRPNLNGSTILFGVAAFLAALLPFHLYIYRQTGSPVFPVYNGLFKSPYWPANSGWDGRWGPKGIGEVVAWPIFCSFQPARLAELAVYSGRISLGFIAALLCFLLPRIDPLIRALCFITLLSSVLWSAATGYIRYALYLELLGGVIILYLASYISANSSRLPPALRVSLVSLPWCILAAQSLLALVYVYRYEWSMRPTIFHDPRAYLAETRHLLRDRRLAEFLPSRERALLDGVGLWIESGMKTSGIEVLLNDDVPVLGTRTHEYFVNEESRKRFSSALERGGGSRMRSLSFAEDIDSALELIASRDLRVEKITSIKIPFYSQRTQLNMILMEVSPGGAGGASAVNPVQTTSITSALPEEAYKARISLPYRLPKLRAGQKEVIYIRVRNASDSIWPAHGRADGKYQLTIGNRWLDAGNGSVVNNMDGRSALINDLRPSDEVELPLTISAPRTPGEYALELDMIQEGVTWFHDRGSDTLRLTLRIEP